MSYKIAFDRPAERGFRRLPADAQQAMARRLSALADDVHPPGRIRHGDYRLVYTVFEEQGLVIVLRVGHRSEVYRDIRGLAQAIRRRRKQNP